jgi:hypothetical protein
MGMVENKSSTRAFRIFTTIALFSIFAKPVFKNIVTMTIRAFYRNKNCHRFERKVLLVKLS